MEKRGFWAAVFKNWPIFHDHLYCDVKKLLCASVGSALQDHNYYLDKPMKNNFTRFSCIQRLPKYSCRNCDFATHVLTLLDYHSYQLKKNHTLRLNNECSGKAYTCGKCNFQTFSRLHLLKHNVNSNCSKLLKAKAGETFRLVMCLDCRERMPLKDLRKHWCQKKFNYRKNPVLTWGLCNEVKAKKKYEGVKVQWFQCAKCPYKSENPHAVMKHLCPNNREMKSQSDLSVSTLVIKKTEVVKNQWLQCAHCMYKALESVDPDLKNHCCKKKITKKTKRELPPPVSTINNHDLERTAKPSLLSFCC